MNVVGPRFGHDVHNGAGETAVLSIERVGEEAKFLNRVERGNDGSPVVDTFFDVATVHEEGIGGLSLSVDRHLAGIQIARNKPVTDRSFGGNRDNPCLQAEQINVAAAI